MPCGVSSDYKARYTFDITGHVIYYMTCNRTCNMNTKANLVTWFVTRCVMLLCGAAQLADGAHNQLGELVEVDGKVGRVRHELVLA